MNEAAPQDPIVDLIGTIWGQLKNAAGSNEVLTSRGNELEEANKELAKLLEERDARIAELEGGLEASASDEDIQEDGLED